ncbi:uncharacterized protein LOC110672097 isoform X4 [Hevea brasiliensis]|uniref:uncharacterized protein LOC110672097 isoform X4 n=1 Tax=Hevea brasiliensis TaxID=3981 RepID=UPI0025CE48F4|nr:uncharacterized protein LOC110672097 isoform X4 [Hevea brasiliensis]
MIVIFKQLNFCPKMQQILELLAQMKIEGWIYWNWVPTVEFRLHEDFCCGYHAFLLRRYLQFTEIRQLSMSVNFWPNRPAIKKVSELDQDFGYSTIVRRPERVLGVGIGIGEPGQPSSFAQLPQ